MVSLAIGCDLRTAHLTPGWIALRAALVTASACGPSIAWTMSTSMAAAAARPASAPIVRNSPWSAKASGVILGHLNTNFPDAISGIISDLHQQGLQFCRNSGPVGAKMPFPASCT
jgi:hypothetical protein